jgi:hypothetical protein
MQTFMTVSNILLWCVLIVQMILFFAITRSVKEFIQRMQVDTVPGLNRSGVVLGQKAPLFSEEDHRGQIVRLHRGAEHRTLLLFTLDECVDCQKLIPKLPKLVVDEPSLRVIVVAQEDLSARDKQIPIGVSLIRSNWLMEQYDVKQTPYYVWIDRDGYVSDLGVAESMQELERR